MILFMIQIDRKFLSAIFLLRFYTQYDLDSCESDSCYRFFTDFVSDVCYYDTCWQQLAYPLTDAYIGERVQHYTLPFFLLTVLGVLGYVAVAKPGWSISI